MLQTIKAAGIACCSRHAAKMCRNIKMLPSNGGVQMKFAKPDFTQLIIENKFCNIVTHYSGK
jgi:hypothetical protein